MSYTMQLQGGRSSIFQHTAIAVLCLGTLIISAAPAAPAQEFQILHSFYGSDGSGPAGGVIRDEAGNLYGTTESGGAYNRGTVFVIESSGQERVLYSFTGGADGGSPEAGLVIDSSGNLYGTALNGGAYSFGTVFRVNRHGQESTLHSFTGGADGAYPWTNLVLDSEGNLYGTTPRGGDTSVSCYFSFSGCGVVFKLDTTNTESVLHTFTNSPDGGYPLAPLVRDAEGNLYGTTQFGGAWSSGDGTVFKLDSSGNETILQSFGDFGSGANFANGGLPVAGLLMTAGGVFYGTNTILGNLNDCMESGCGTIFKMDKTGNVLPVYTFTGYLDGAFPSSGLVQDAAGNLFGTSNENSSWPYGEVFKLIPGGSLIMLHGFLGGAEGVYPSGTLVLDAEGNIYGTASGGGAHSLGMVFVIRPQ